MNSREIILERVGRASDSPVKATPRNYRGPAGPGSRDLFIQRLLDYRAVARVVALDDLTREIERSLRVHHLRNVIIPPGFPSDWLRDVAIEMSSDIPELSITKLDHVDGVITTCSVAIAETGTIVLSHGAGQGRRALTLVPDYHLVIVRESQIVAGVPDAVAALDSASPLTWISGPSATSDIELTRVEGVHGPRNLELIIIKQGRRSPRGCLENE